MTRWRRHTIRLFGDPVLKQRAPRRSTDIDGDLAQLVDAMYETMYDAPGVGLAAPQVGVQQRFFVYDVDDDGPHVLFNPEIVEASGRVDLRRGLPLAARASPSRSCGPKLVTVQGLDLDGNEVVIEGDELLGRVFLHEIDHLDGVLMLDRLEPDAAQGGDARAARAGHGRRGRRRRRTPAL